MVVRQSKSQFVGPLPPPHILENYENIKQGFAERIFSMAEKEQYHRHERRKARAAAEARGQYFAFSICLLAIVGGMVLVWFDHDVPGTILGGSTIGWLAYVFITGSRKGGGTNARE